MTDITNGSTWLSTTTSVLDGQSVVQEVVDKPGTSNDETVTYLTGAAGPTYRRGGNGVKTWYAYDGLGSVLGEISSSTGNLTKSRVYDVYGTVRADTAATSASNRKFVGKLGHPSEGETGLIYMRARYMDPETGRFTSEDRAKNGSNWFVYCNDDPVNRMDRTGKAWGLYADLIIGGLLILLGGAFIAAAALSTIIGIALVVLGCAIAFVAGPLDQYNELGTHIQGIDEDIGKQRSSSAYSMSFSALLAVATYQGACAYEMMDDI